MIALLILIIFGIALSLLTITGLIGGSIVILLAIAYIFACFIWYLFYGL